MTSAVLVAGSSGLLGSAFMRAGGKWSFTAVARGLLLNAATAELRDAIEAHQPSVLVNCAAHTDVEGGEDDLATVFDANVRVAAALAHETKRIGCRFVHISSTGCYGDWKDTPYVEGDELRPRSVHHKTKASAEEVVRLFNPDALILRVGWLFGGGRELKRNFVWNRIREAQGRDTLAADAGQRGNPTFAGDVARVGLELADAEQTGVFNLVGGGPVATRLEYVEEILAAAGVQTKVFAGEFPRRAPVAKNEAAFNQRLERTAIAEMPDWRDSLRRYVTESASGRI